MSEERWELDVAATAAEHYEAMTTAGHAMLRGKHLATLICQSIFIGFNAPIGATMLLFILVHAFGGPKFSDLPIFAMPVAYVCFALLTFWLSRQAYFMVAQMTTQTRFGRAQQVTLDASGITLTTESSRWHSGWADVELLRGAKNVLVVGISGIAIALPRRAFLGPLDANDALEVMQRWQVAAR
jgi:hypothetical protein